MNATLDVERPPEATAVDVTLVARGITISACIERAEPDTLVVAPVAAAYARRLGVELGDRLEVFWRTGSEERSLPAVVERIDDGFDELRWALVVTGPAERSQRRKAVRARVQLPVLLVCQATQLIGETVDISEAGLRADVDGWGLPPEAGTPVQAALTLEDTVLDLHGVVVRGAVHGARWQLSLSFDSVGEDLADRLRSRVFQALREERARLTD